MECLRLPALLGALVLAALASIALAGAPMDNLRIEISGGGLRAPVVITGPVIRQFHVGKGPGNFRISGGIREPIDIPHGFIIDWSRGITGPPINVATYEVAFVTARPTRNIYRVRYAVDPSTGRGYVYLPGQGEPAYEDNVFMILRGVEGNWFHAWSRWEELARTVIRRASR